jgi:hypothetical protein
MTESITLTLPEELSTRVRQIAETTSQPVEQVVLDHLKGLALPLPALPPDERTELDALHRLSDDALRTIAREQMPEEDQRRARQLMNKNERGKLSRTEADDLARLVERADGVMLRKAEASSILRQRGYPFTQADFRPQDE